MASLAVFKRTCNLYRSLGAGSPAGPVPTIPLPSDHSLVALPSNNLAADYHVDCEAEPPGDTPGGFCLG